MGGLLKKSPVAECQISYSRSVYSIAHRPLGGVGFSLLEDASATAGPGTGSTPLPNPTENRDAARRAAQYCHQRR